jgi:hypothetical protein
VGSRAGLDVAEKEQKLLPTPGIETWFSSLVTVSTEPFRILHDTFTLLYIFFTEKEESSN